jgi:uncharacterized membrane protein YkvA (DUF1232 family)
MSSLFPEDLTQKEFALLTECANSASDIPTLDLINSAKLYLEQVRQAHVDNLYVNLNLAEAIFNNFCTAIEAWDDLPNHSRPWIKGMIRYFCLSSDLESDFDSPIGFDDDVEIMNACLRLAGREDLCINPEDFDDV